MGSLSATVKQELIAAVGAEHVRDDPEALVAYSYDATPLVQAMPDAVVFPGSTEEVAAVLRIASRHGVPVIPRGSGTNLSAGTVPVKGGIVLVLTRLNRILEIDEENLTVTVQPGVITQHLHQAVEARGLFYPPDPGSMRIATIGGNIAECAGGLRGLKYGTTKDYVLGLEAVLMSGEVIRTGGKLVKDVAGYDLTRLLVGSEGTLAVITEATLRLLPKPEHRKVMSALFDDLYGAARRVCHHRPPHYPVHVGVHGSGHGSGRRGLRARRPSHRHRRLPADRARRARSGGGTGPSAHRRHLRGLRRA